MMRCLHGSALAVLAALAGCAAYVNVPDQGGDIAMHNPNLPTVGEVEAESLRAVLMTRPINRQFQVVLPPGTRPAQYVAVTSQLGEQATWSFKAPPEEMPTVWVRQVRIRGGSAEVDVVVPDDPSRPTGPFKLMTARLKWSAFGGWRTHRVRSWRTGVRDTLPAVASEERAAESIVTRAMGPEPAERE